MPYINIIFVSCKHNAQKITANDVGMGNFLFADECLPSGDTVTDGYKESFFAHTRTNCAKELVTIPGANHVFAGDHTAPMVDKVVSWVKARFA